jgi:hypothetical protein
MPIGFIFENLSKYASSHGISKRCEKFLRIHYSPRKVACHAWLLPQSKATYFRNTPFHRLYLKVIAITFPTSHKTSIFSLTYFPRIQLTIKKINNKDSIIFTIYFKSKFKLHH